MKRPVRTHVNRLLVAALAATPMMACAAAGEFTFVVGEVGLTKANGTRVTPARGTVVDPGDRVSTGANGMAQLTMVDNARLSLRPGTQFQIEAYPDRKDSNDGAILNLVRGTLRTFTGLIAATNRDKFVMKTRVATVGIRGSGNILYACEGKDCDESVAAGTQPEGGITVNYTIEGSHAVTNVLADTRPGLPAQQGGAQTVITGPGQTVMVAGNQPPRYIPLPRFIGEAAINMTAAKAAETAAPPSGSSADTRNFSPSDTPALPASQRSTTPVLGNNGLGFVNAIDATGNLGNDPIALHDVIIVSGSPFLGQARQSRLQMEGNSLRGYVSYPEVPGNIQPTISGGTLRDFQGVTIDNQAVLLGRWENASLGFSGGGAPIPGSIHWVVAPSGYPAYLADVLTGTATYTLVAATLPTNQNNLTGTLGAARIDANFTSRTLGVQIAFAIPNAGSWQIGADSVAFAFNTFFGSSGDRVLVTNGSGQSSRTNSSLTGSFEGSFVGNGLGGAILGYNISDRTAANPASWQFVSGAAALSSTRQSGAASYREGRVSDPQGFLADFVRSYSTTDRPDEVVGDAQGRLSAFSAPHAQFGPHATYAIGTAQVVESGFDADTGMVWGRWGGGVARIARDGVNLDVVLNGASLHYIFAGSQSGPVALPLTGSAVYDVIGSTHPTNSHGDVGTLNSATLSANFTARMVDAAVNISIANQTWSGGATNLPIYREQYFSAYSGTPISGVPNPTPLAISCAPNCGSGATGSIDGFFAGRTGQRAGMMYNLGGNQGAVAFGRRGG